MATNHTSNYTLNQWEPDDAVIRIDFNEDNAKIDAALAAKAETSALAALQAEVAALKTSHAADLAAVKAANYFHCIYDKTLTAAAATLDIPLSHLDLSQYRMVKILFNGCIPQKLNLTFNGDGSASYITGGNNGSGSIINESCLLLGSESYGTYSQTELDLYPFLGQWIGFYRQVMALGERYYHGYSAGGYYTGCDLSQVTKLAVVPESGSIPAGCQFTIYGFKKP